MPVPERSTTTLWQQFVPPLQGGAAHDADVFTWWESRRLRYNAALGVAGLASTALLVTAAVLFELLGHGDALPVFDEPIGLLVGPLLFAFAANVAYTAGWVVELLLRPWLRGRGERIGPVLFRAGLLFSLVVTLGVAVLALVLAVLRVAGVLPPLPPAA